MFPPSPRSIAVHLRKLLLAVPLFACLPFFSFADSLKITSNPPGVSVELDGVRVGTTPFEKDFPGGFFHRTRTALGQRLEHPMVARLSFLGYATRGIVLTRGPMEWIDLLAAIMANTGYSNLTSFTQTSILSPPHSPAPYLLLFRHSPRACKLNSLSKSSYAAPNPRWSA